ncbi:MAG: hypothetical protein LUG60_15030 [Erysipelotrichaceae bacterium]|nr:hypothetical protein [Erysipelotrichaceae bacterium]
MEEESKEKQKKKKSHRTGVKFDPFYIEGSIQGLKKTKKGKKKESQ